MQKALASMLQGYNDACMQIKGLATDGDSIINPSVVTHFEHLGNLLDSILNVTVAATQDESAHGLRLEMIARSESTSVQENRRLPPEYDNMPGCHLVVTIERDEAQQKANEAKQEVELSAGAGQDLSGSDASYLPSSSAVPQDERTNGELPMLDGDAVEALIFGILPEPTHQGIDVLNGFVAVPPSEQRYAPSGKIDEAVFDVMLPTGKIAHSIGVILQSYRIQGKGGERFDLVIRRLDSRI